MNSSRWYFIPADDAQTNPISLRHLITVDRELYPLMRVIGYVPIAGRQWDKETQNYVKVTIPQAAESGDGKPT